MIERKFKHGRKEIVMKKLFQNWTFKKHFKLVSIIYLTCYAIDMTVTYAVIKKYIDNSGKDKDLTAD